MIQLLIAVGGAIGAVARYEASRLITPAGAGAFPWGTFVINVVGSLILGFLYKYFDQFAAPEARAFLGIGFCGGFTTFSAFSFDAVSLFQDGQHARALLYVLGSVAFSILGAVVGIAIGSAVVRT